MKGCYNGLQVHLKKENEDLHFNHCMAHVLNLVVADSTMKLLQAEDLFGLVEETAVFLSSSHKRIAVWQKENILFMNILQGAKNRNNEVVEQG